MEGSKLTETEKGETSEEHVIIFFDIEVIVHKEFVMAGQTVISAYYRGALRRMLENVRRFRPELRRQKNWFLHNGRVQSHTSFFTREFLAKRNMTDVPNPPYFSLSLWHFYTAWRVKVSYNNGMVL
jgi:hypothetical protein